MNDEDLGFSWTRLKQGEVSVRHVGRLAATLRGDTAVEFLAEMESANFAEQQQSMARLTGNYKHGNERTAIDHPRNRR